MSKKTKLSKREKHLVATAQASMLAVEIKENGLMSEGIFSGVADFFTGGQYSSQVGAMERGARGAWGSAAADLALKAKDIGPVLEELKTKADDGIKTAKSAIDTITDAETKKFFEQSIEESASRIAAVQEEELNRIANAVVKRVDTAKIETGEEVKENVDDETKKAITAIILQGAMLGALVINLK